MVVTLTEFDRWFDHLDYELSSACELPRWVEYFDIDGPAVVKNACLESALLHCRNLIEFVADRRPEVIKRRRKHGRRNITAADLLTQWVPPRAVNFDKWLKTIDMHLVGLSSRRAELGVPNLRHLTDLVDDVLAAIEAFGDALDAAGSPYAARVRSSVEDGRSHRARELGEDFASVG
jgi:hypothetical protein